MFSLLSRVFLVQVRDLFIINNNSVTSWGDFWGWDVQGV